MSEVLVSVTCVKESQIMEGAVPDFTSAVSASCGFQGTVCPCLWSAHMAFLWTLFFLSTNPGPLPALLDLPQSLLAVFRELGLTRKIETSCLSVTTGACVLCDGAIQALALDHF